MGDVGTYYLAFLLKVNLGMVGRKDVVGGSDYGASHFESLKML